MPQLVRQAVWSLLALTLWPLIATAQVSEPVVIGVLAKRGEQITLQRWQATADYLSEQVSGERFLIRPLDFDEIFPAAQKGEVDFILANSAFYVELEMRFGASRIVTMRNRLVSGAFSEFGGVLFTRADNSDIQSINQIRGRRFGAVEANSLGGYLAAKRELLQAGVDVEHDTTLSFLGTHDAVVDAVLNGDIDVGTVRTDTLETMAREGRIELDKIRVIAPQSHPGFPFLSSTTLYPEWPLARLSSTSVTLGDRVAAALLRMPADSTAAIRGRMAGWSVPHNYQPVHALMKELQFGPYSTPKEVTVQDIVRQYSAWIAASLLILMVMLTATLWVVRLNQQLRHSRRELEEARSHLQEQVEERTSSLRKALQEVEQANAQLDLSRKQWNEAFDAISTPVFIHDLDNRLLRYNRAYADAAGVSSDESLIGQYYWKLYPKLDKPLHACASFPERTPEEGEEVVLADRSIIHSRSFAIRDAQGQPSSAIHILEDVTAERKAIAERRVLSQALEQARDGILVLNDDSTIRYGNAAIWALIGLGAESGNGRPITDFFTPALVPQLRETLHAVEGGRAWSGDAQLLGEDGRSLPVHLGISAVFDAYHSHTGFVLTVVDQSYVKEAESALNYRLAFERLLNEIASRFVDVGSEGLVDGLQRSLEALGRFAGAEYVYLYAIPQRQLDATLVACPAENLPARIQALRESPEITLPWLLGELEQQRKVFIADSDQLSSEAELDQEWLIKGGVGPLLAWPLASSGSWIGFVIFERLKGQRPWSPDEQQLFDAPLQLIANAIRRYYAEETVHNSESNLAEAQKIAHLGNWVWDIVANTLQWSDEVYRIFGLEPQQFEATYDAFLSHVHPEDRDLVTEGVNTALEGKSRYSVDHRIVRPDGQERIVHEMGAVHYDEFDRPVKMIGTVQDVTETRHAQHELQRLNRALRTLSRGNEILVRSNNEQELLDNVCQILIEYGDFRFAWIGYARHDQKRRVEPMAYAGEGIDLSDTNISWADNDHGQGPTGVAIREQRNVVMRDLLHDKAFAPWRHSALSGGYHAMIALPLQSAGATYGALTIAADDADAFDVEEVKLLTEMVNDVAFGIRNLRMRIERARAEQALAESESRFRAIFETATDGVVVCDSEHEQLHTANRAFSRLSGYSLNELKGMRLSQLFPSAEWSAPQHDDSSESMAGAMSEKPLLRKDDMVTYVDISATPIQLEGRDFVLYEFHDISERKLAEEERRHGVERLQRALVQTIQAMAITIEKRDPYTAGHQQRVAEIAVIIAKRLGLDEDRIEGVRLGAMIHDIGKIYVPAEILNRPGRLTDVEYEMIKVHPAVGYDIAKGIEFPWPVAEMVHQHHERIDGSGYPQGLKGEEILFEARLIAVADVLEAITTHRPYRPAHTAETAIEELSEYRGDRYDPQIVDVCLALLEEGAFTFDEAPA